MNFIYSRNFLCTSKGQNPVFSTNIVQLFSRGFAMICNYPNGETTKIPLQTPAEPRAGQAKSILRILSRWPL